MNAQNIIDICQYILIFYLIFRPREVRVEKTYPNDEFYGMLLPGIRKEIRDALERYGLLMIKREKL